MIESSNEKATIVMVNSRIILEEETNTCIN